MVALALVRLPCFFRIVLGAMDTYKGAGEVRRINVVYFLSRGGKTEHPHLLRVGHLGRAGVRLRDVKRWLAELRGKDMPDSFSWSYKRKYKTGYVWQDLMDDDLVTPISDNEYVLKGCDIAARTLPPATAADGPALDEKTTIYEVASLEWDDKAALRDLKPSEEIQVTVDAGEDSETGRDANGESARRTVIFKIDLSEEELRPKQQRRQQEEEKTAIAEAGARAEEEATAPGDRPVGKSRSMRVSQVFHNLLMCGAADTNDAALRPVPRPRQQRIGSGGSDRPPTPRCPGIDGCGFQKRRSRRGGKEKGGKKRDGGEAGSGDARKPAILPRCSQCGKEFKPQELHAHMQSCRALKERMRSGSNLERSTSRQGSSRKDSNHSSSGSAVFLLKQS